MAISSIGGASAAAQAGATASKATDDTDPAAFAQILDAFKKEAAKTPAERARDEVLKKHNLTEKSYAALPPEQKKAIDAEIATAVQRAMQTDKSKGFKGAETAATVTPGTSDSLSFLTA
jgi:hypothetical protein